MMGPEFPDWAKVVIEVNTVTDPDTGNKFNEPVHRMYPANLQRTPHFTDDGQFVTNTWILLLPPGVPILPDADFPIYAKRKEQADWTKFEIEDIPAVRRDALNGWSPAYIAVSLKYISDLQKNL